MTRERTSTVKALQPALDQVSPGEMSAGVRAAADGLAADVAADVVAAGRGDHGAFTRLVGVYDERLRVLAYRLLGSRQAMDDVLQDAYLAAYRGLRRFRGEADVGTWLYRIVYNACLQRLRRDPPAEPDAAEVLEHYPAGGLDIVDEVALRDQLCRALADLPPTQRAAVLLVHREGLSYGDAAEVLGVPVGTVASRVAAARTALAVPLECTRSRKEER
jgi:RNA polymerase sigma-70 factor, ECF subfamily